MNREIREQHYIMLGMMYYKLVKCNENIDGLEYKDNLQNMIDFLIGEIDDINE